MVEMDGSFGEGGGQILRTSLALSCLFEQPFRISNIRKGRKRPGLMPQHLTCVRAAAEISGAEISGYSVGSPELTFKPRKIRSGDYSFDIGTAGSTSLVLQTLLPPLLLVPETSTLTISGGTHVPFSPTFNYISEVFLPTLGRLGIDVKAHIDSYGFYPRGGGKVRFVISPCRGIESVNLARRGQLTGIEGVSAVGNLPISIAIRQKEALISHLQEFETDIKTSTVNTPGRGTFIFLKARYGDSLAGFSALGERGKRAEQVGEEAVREFFDYHSSGMTLDHHMADQIVLYLALADGESNFSTARITEHLKTNLHVIKSFMNIDYRITSHNYVNVKGRAARPI
jgi:RNA 3'-terminal phosphate cyclase (ATP)